MPVLRVNPEGFLGSRVLRLLALLLGWAVRLLGRTCRFEVAGSEHIEELVLRGEPAILCFWHNRAILGGCHLLRTLHRRGKVRFAMLASDSQDGELVAYLGRYWRMRVVRGSATRGGRRALVGLYRAVTRHRCWPVLVPDGPQGPLYEFKNGVAVLAQMTKAPLIPIGLAAGRFWELGSWDRLIVPRPWTRIAVEVGPPQRIGRALAADGLEEERQRVESLLTELTRAAEVRAGSR